MVTALPAAVTMTVLLVARATRSSKRSEPCTAALAALSVAAGYGVAHVVRHGWPALDSWAQWESWQWLLWFVVAAAALASFRPSKPLWTWTLWLLRIILVSGGLTISLRPYWQHTWDPAAAARWIACLTGAFCLYWFLLDALLEKTPAASSTLSVLIVALGTGIALVLTGSQRLAELAINLGSITAVLSVMCLRNEPRPLAKGIFAVAPVILGGLWLTGCFYSETKALTIGLLAAAPFAAWIWNLPPVSRLGPAALTTVRLVAVLAVVLVAVVPLILAFTPDPYAGY